jgi:hypothetical protein
VHKTVVGSRSRRAAMGSLALLLPGLLLGGRDAAAQKGGKSGGGGGGKGGGGDKKGKKGNKGKKRKRAKKPNPAATCSEGACAAEPEWAGRPGQIGHCESICRLCDGGDSREFCIRDGTKPDGTPTKVAVCCEEGEKCCGASCCPEGRVCCGGDQCCREGYTCCGGYCCGTNDPYTACCDGWCMNTLSANNHCGFCGNACGAGELCVAGSCVCNGDCDDDECPDLLTLCSGRCVRTQTDPTNCGSCSNSCGGGGRECINGTCQCPTDYPVECPAGCYEEGFQCCANGLACEPGSQCFQQNGSWGCCWPGFSCPSD